MKPTLKLASVSIGSSILGRATQPKIPAGIANPLTTTGRVTGRFIPLTATMGGMSFTTKKLKTLEKKMKGGKK